MTKLETINAEDLQNRTYEPTHFLVDELIPEGLHILAGAPKIGKSWLPQQRQTVDFPQACRKCRFFARENNRHNRPCECAERLYRAVRRVSPLCAAFRPTCEACAQQRCKSQRCADVCKKYKIASQQRDCDFERRRSGMDETCRLRRGEGYGACADEGASIAFG